MKEATVILSTLCNLAHFQLIQLGWALLGEVFENSWKQFDTCLAEYCLSSPSLGGRLFRQTGTKQSGTARHRVRSGPSLRVDQVRADNEIPMLLT